MSDIHFGRNFLTCPVCEGMTLTWELYCLRCDKQFELTEQHEVQRMREDAVRLVARISDLEQLNRRFAARRKFAKRKSDRVSAENERLRADCAQINLEREELRAEIERLRRALEQIENLGAESDGKTDLTVKMFYIAHWALGGEGKMGSAATDYPIHISRREAMELSVETRRKIMKRMTDAFMDAMMGDTEGVPLNTIAQIPDANVEQFYADESQDA